MDVYYLHDYSDYTPEVRTKDIFNTNGPVFTPKKTKLKGYQKRK
jgi:hypothetical protein